ncbi:MAG TPA: pitrilysin family protein [Mycobacteriales bacterium]|nr:pitrilysin family protein [Mycobacteriales bacterium]
MARAQVLSSGQDGTAIRRTVLPGGLRVITEAMPQVRSVALGIWVGVGSRDETPRQAGASHFLEHLLFKGTKRRDALEIAAVMDAVGGEMNAFTAKEYTCFHARVLDADLPLAVDVLVDMVGASLIATTDVESERGVILEEIAMHDDQPDDVVHDAFAAAMFGDHPLGRPVIGTVDSIEAMSRTSVHGYWRRRYRASDMVIAAAGNLDHAKVVRLVRKAFEPTGLLDVDATPGDAREAKRMPPVNGSLHVTRRPTEQAHLVFGTGGIARRDERRYALAVLNNALGGGMSSRLFQEVREKRGLAYSVYSYHSQYADGGLFGVYAGCAPAKVHEVLSLCRDQLDLVTTKGITSAEIARAKGQLKGSMVLGLEDTSSRMSRLGKGDLVYGEIQTVDDVIAKVDAVTLDDVREIAREVISGDVGLAVIGPFDDSDFAAYA